MKLQEIFEMQFKDYVPSADEINDEIAQTQKTLAMYKQQGKAPMVAKMQMRLDQLMQKKSKLSESADDSDYAAKLKRMSAAKLQAELDDLLSIADSANKTEHGDEIQDCIEMVRAELKRTRA